MGIILQVYWQNVGEYRLKERKMRGSHQMWPLSTCFSNDYKSESALETEERNGCHCYFYREKRKQESTSGALL